MGMEGIAAGAVPIDPSLLHRGQVVADLVYHPLITPLLEAARAQGAQIVGGLGMLVHQAALAVERWTGQVAPVEAMWTAVHERPPPPADSRGPAGGGGSVMIRSDRRAAGVTRRSEPNEPLSDDQRQNGDCGVSL